MINKLTIWLQMRQKIKNSLNNFKNNKKQKPHSMVMFLTVIPLAK